MNDQQNSSKIQIVEKLRSAESILVTVSANPSIDQLSACIATTLLLNKFKKNATAVFSGKVPSALEFLKPKDTIEKTTDSLRDFIIALDKSKADKLRYKVEDDVVKIFITPYRTSITEKDLKYSAGEFNVDVILALGVQHQQDLDSAITAHGRIFHDAVVMSINNMPGGDFGVANWEDLASSSLSELIANLIAELDPALMDTAIATALLTGIVAETSRFSNEKTHPSTMAISSKLLEAGADQQLVNMQLRDYISTVDKPVAGTEIAPTVPIGQEAADHDEVTEELIIDEHGALEPIDFSDVPNTQKIEAPASENMQPSAPVEAAQAEVSAAEPYQSPSPQPETPAKPDEPAVATPSQSTDTYSADVQPSAGPTLPPADYVADAQPSEENDAPDEAEAARQAVENALSGIAGQQSQEPPIALAAEPTEVAEQESAPDDVLSAPPVPDVQAGQGAMPAAVPFPEPLIQPIPPNQASYANPLTTTVYDQPAPAQNEPAPLGMSPADQAFTMPMPPTSSMTPSTPPAPQSPDNGAMPPPLPPPMAPPSFGGTGR
jgi:hypothetical protein